MQVANRMPVANHLLGAVPRNDCQPLLAGLEPVALSSGEVLHEPGAPIRHVYFPNDALVSLLMVDGHLTLKIGLVGREGMVGMALALRINVSQVRAVVQKDGAAMRMTSARLYIAHMLGVRRVSVTKAAGALQQRKLIDYSRSNIRILDQRGLEAASCRCYRIIKDMPS